MDNGSRRLLDVAISETDRLDRIISDFLQFARRKRLKLRRVNIGKLVEETCLLLKSRKEQSNVALEMRIDSKLYCSCDRDQIQQVFLNLGLNSLEAMDEDGTLRVEAQVEDRIVPGLSVRFIDSGRGIVEEEKEHLFEPFWSTKPSGTGLGLAFATRIALDHGGSIDAVNNELGGATFSLWLPVERAGERD